MIRTPLSTLLLVVIVGCPSIEPEAPSDRLPIMEDNPSEDAAPQDAAGPPVQCSVPIMSDMFSDLTPPNPTELPEAPSCADYDVILVLGCPNNEDGTPSDCQKARADIAVAFRKAGLAQAIITSGSAVKTGEVEAETLRDLLVEREVPLEDIHVEPRAEHTDENLYWSTLLMLKSGWKTALVVSEAAGHIVYTAMCDSNCCVDRGRLTPFRYQLEGRPNTVAGHYQLYPDGEPVTSEECEHVKLRLLCLALDSRRACKDNFTLDTSPE